MRGRPRRRRWPAQGSGGRQYAERVGARVAGQWGGWGRRRLVAEWVLQHGLGEAGQLGGGQWVTPGIEERVALLLFGLLICSEGGSGGHVAHAQRINSWVTAGVHQVVEAGGGLLDQQGQAVRVLGVALEGGVGGDRAGGRAVAVRRPQVILQTLHVFGVADPQQLCLLLGAQEGLQDGGVVVEAGGALQRHGQEGGEDGSRHLGWSLSLRSLGGHEGEEAVGVEVRVAQPDWSRLELCGHHHCSLGFAGGLGDALWVVGVGAGLVDFTEVLEVVVEGGTLL